LNILEELNVRVASELGVEASVALDNGLTLPEDVIFPTSVPASISPSLGPTPVIIVSEKTTGGCSNV
jgi:hypothetical protein